MAFVVEDGTGLDNATSLCSVEFADSYFEDRLDEDWLDSDDEIKQKALIEATDYVMYVWEEKMKGDREFEVQATPYPRIVNGEHFYPDLIRKAVAEYANRARVAPLMPDFDQDNSSKLITSEQKELEGLGKKGVTYSEFNKPSAQKRYPIPDKMMRPLLNFSNSNFVIR